MGTLRAPKSAKKRGPRNREAILRNNCTPTAPNGTPGPPKWTPRATLRPQNGGPRVPQGSPMGSQWGSPISPLIPLRGQIGDNTPEKATKLNFAIVGLHGTSSPHSGRVAVYGRLVDPVTTDWPKGKIGLQRTRSTRGNGPLVPVPRSLQIQLGIGPLGPRGPKGSQEASGGTQEPPKGHPKEPKRF